MKDANHRKILILLDQKPSRAEDLCRQIKEMSHEAIDRVLSELQEEGFIHYRFKDDRWELIKTDNVLQN